MRSVLGFSELLPCPFIVLLPSALSLAPSPLKGWNPLVAEPIAEDFPMTAVAPWRIATPVTAGLMAQWLQLQFLRIPFWGGFDPKSGKFQCPTPTFWADTDDPPRKKAA